MRYHFGLYSNTHRFFLVLKKKNEKFGGNSVFGYRFENHIVNPNNRNDTLGGTTNKSLFSLTDIIQRNIFLFHPHSMCCGYFEYLFAGYPFQDIAGRCNDGIFFGNDKKIGTTVKKGEIIATLGSSPINGDYAPHLHFQIIIDIQNKIGDYPGVCSKNNLEFYSQNCPNPNLLLKIK